MPTNRRMKRDALKLDAAILRLKREQREAVVFVNQQQVQLFLICGQKEVLGRRFQGLMTERMYPQYSGHNHQGKAEKGKEKSG